jgi:hypothetical protein
LPLTATRPAMRCGRCKRVTRLLRKLAPRSHHRARFAILIARNTRFRLQLKAPN